MSKTASSCEELNFGKYHVDAIAVSPDDRVVIAASSLTTNVWDGVLQVVRWPGADSASGVEVQASFATATGNAAVAWLTDDSLAAGGDDGTVSIWTLPPAGHTALGGVQVPPVKLAAHAGAVTCVGVSGGINGAQLASASLDGTARLWDASAGKSGAVRSLEHVSDQSWCATHVHALVWAEEHGLATAASDGVLRWWDTRAARPLAGQCSAETGAALLSLAASTETAQHYVGTEAGGVLLVDRRKPDGPLITSRPHTAPVCALQMGPPAAAAGGGGGGGGGGGKPRLATASDDCTVCLLAAHDLRSELRLAAHDDFARCLGWLATPAPGGGAALLSGGWDKRLMRHTLQL